MACETCTFVEVFGLLAGVATAVGAALLHCGALGVLLTALHARGSKATGLLGGGAVALLHPLHRLQELTARQTLVVLLGKERLEGGREEEEGGGTEGKNICQIIFKFRAARP